LFELAGDRHGKTAPGEAVRNQFIEYRVADCISHFIGHGNRRSQRATLIAKLRQLDPRPIGGLDRADAMNGDLYPVDIDFG
jgi:hypothetical protein